MLASIQTILTSLIHDPISVLTTIVAIVAVFGTVIFVHEFGHFIVAKKSGVKVDEFAFGFGPKVFSFQYGETLYSVNWIPLGGFNKFQGEVTENYSGPVLEGEGSHQDPSKDRSRDFMAQPWHRRFLIALAGPVMNYLLAFVLFSFMLLYWGDPVATNKTEIGEVVSGMPADAAGIQKGDRVISVENQKMEDFPEVALKIHDRADQKTTIIVSRNNEEHTFELIPKNEGGKGFIGIRPADPIIEHQKISVLGATKKAGWQCWNISFGTIYYLYHSITTRQKPELSGPIGITQVIAKTAKQGMENLLYLVAMISVAIGLFNLFPIPMLDGGHLMYYTIEGVQRRPVSEKMMGRVNMVGMALLLCLLVFSTFSDIQRMFQPKQSTSTTAPQK